MAQRRTFESARIVALCIEAAIAYGIVHDQVTARTCIEYFTIGHPDLWGNDNPTLHGLAWGVLATWWVGLTLGIGLAVAAQAGPRPPLPARRLIWPISVLLAVMACAAFVSGVAGHIAASRGWVYLVEPLRSQVPADRHVPFLTDLWIHNASYATGFLGGVVLCVRVWRGRLHPADADSI